MLPAVSQVAATLHFNPNLEYLADRVVAYITRDGRRRFNGAPALRVLCMLCAESAGCTALRAWPACGCAAVLLRLLPQPLTSETPFSCCCGCGCCYSLQGRT